MADDRLPPAVRTLIGAGVKLARSTTSGRVAFAHAYAVVDPAAVPEPLRAPITKELDGAAAAVAPLDAKAVAKALKDAWGREHGKVVDGLDPAAPLAVTPGAQTHRATLDGEDVVVKLLRPGLRESIRSDLGLLETLTAPAGAAFPAVDAGAVIREVRERVLDELDLEHESSTQRTVARALRRHATITVPAPVTELSEEGVMVSAHVAGPTLAGGVPAGTDPGAIARTVLRAALGLPRTTGIVHADLEPANIILTGPESIALVDFGASRRVDAARLDQGLEALAALRAGDEAAFTGAVLALGVLPDAESCAAALALLRAVGGELLTGPATLDAAALLALADRADAHTREAFALAMKATLDPQDLWPLRMLGTLVATLARLGATEDWIALALEAGREGC
jgi:predicted unusual protein kinase regulating ubiquinone biosynthesis (AarF/ABC1/UbiB family)